jgi:hypothetical protein
VHRPTSGGGGGGGGGCLVPRGDGGGDGAARCFGSGCCGFGSGFFASCCGCCCFGLGGCFVLAAFLGGSSNGGGGLAPRGLDELPFLSSGGGVPVRREGEGRGGVGEEALMSLPEKTKRMRFSDNDEKTHGCYPKLSQTGGRVAAERDGRQ